MMEAIRDRMQLYYNSLERAVRDEDEGEIEKYLAGHASLIEEIIGMDVNPKEKQNLLKWCMDRHNAIHKIAAQKKKQFEDILRSDSGVTRAIRGYRW